MIELLQDVTSPHAASLREAILLTLAYSDVFDYPLRLDEIHRYLSVFADVAQVRTMLERGVECVSSRDGFYFLEGRDQIVTVRRARAAISRPALHRAFQYGRILGRLPFIRMVALTGSLALLNADERGDLDYMLVTAPGRVWTARGFALLFGRLTAPAGHTLCPNLIVSETALEWPEHDIYSAREICQMIPITGQRIYDRLRCVNHWADQFLPNAVGAPGPTDPFVMEGSAPQAMAEWPLRGRLGNRLEAWEMGRKIRRFTRQPGFGTETRFDADVCQGNFLHHGAHTRMALQQRLAKLHIDAALFTSPSDSD